MASVNKVELLKESLFTKVEEKEVKSNLLSSLVQRDQLKSEGQPNGWKGVVGSNSHESMQVSSGAGELEFIEDVLSNKEVKLNEVEVSSNKKSSISQLFLDESSVSKPARKDLSKELISKENLCKVNEENQEKSINLNLSVDQSMNAKLNKVKLISEVEIVKQKLKVVKCNGCGNKLESGNEDPKLDMVKLFEHVNAAGVPNFQCCKIPVCQSTLNLAVWRKKLKDYKDKVVCELLQYGFPLDFNRERKLSGSGGRNHKGARDYPHFINKYLQRECAANRIAGPFPSNPLSVELTVSPMNTVPKDCDDERRVIVDLSWPAGGSVNDGISKDIYLGEVIELHYASVEQVCNMANNIGPGAMIYKRDLRHAYRQIAVDPRDYSLLGYCWEDMYYFDSVLAMGQRNAAMACSRTTDAIIYMHQQNGYNATNYLDDLIGVSAPSDSWNAYNSLGDLLHELGLLENIAKACPPSTIQIVLGVLINTVEGTISVPDERMQEIVSLVNEWQGKSKSTKIELQSLIGKLQYITKCVLQSRVFLNRLLEVLRSMKGSKSVKLTKSFQKDLKWWSMFIDKYNGVSFIPSAIWNEPDVTFATDSCLVGCGGICEGEYFHIGYPKKIRDQQLPIHSLEMLAVLLGVRIWGARLQTLKIQIYCDNEPAVRVINSGKTKDTFMGSCIRELWLEVSKYGFQLRAVHLPGEQNRVPDWLSRWDCGQTYRDLFHQFIGGEPEKYNEIMIDENLFDFSGDL